MSLYQNRIVVKVGTSTLTNENGKTDLRAFDRLALVLSDVQNMGYEVVLVSQNECKRKTHKPANETGGCGWGTMQHYAPL